MNRENDNNISSISRIMSFFSNNVSIYYHSLLILVNSHQYRSIVY